MSLPYITELTPLAFLERAAAVHPGKTAIGYGGIRITYAEFAAHATRIARALRTFGVRDGDRVAYLAPNAPELLIAHFAVPLARAVLVAINTRLSGAEIGYILGHCGARVLVADAALAGKVPPDVRASLSHLVVIGGTGFTDPTWLPYAAMLESGDAGPLPWSVADENTVISVNYTSGTTGRPKGVMYTHRGAYLNALGEIIHSQHHPDSVYLWTVPMFHCNGWCTTWAVTATGGTHICLAGVELRARERRAH